jgi:hypothetical protein
MFRHRSSLCAPQFSSAVSVHASYPRGSSFSDLSIYNLAILNLMTAFEVINKSTIDNHQIENEQSSI